MTSACAPPARWVWPWAVAWPSAGMMVQATRGLGEAEFEVESDGANLKSNIQYSAF